jgi:hypothetical protein
MNPEAVSPIFLSEPESYCPRSLVEDAMKIEILGTGCYNCIKLETLIQEVLTELKRGKYLRIDDERIIRKYMPMDELPGLLINGVLVSTRELPYWETPEKLAPECRGENCLRRT